MKRSEGEMLLVNRRLLKWNTIHARFSRFNSCRHNEMWGLDFPHFTPKYKRTILEAIYNCGGDKIFKLGTDGIIRKFHSRRKRHIVRSAREVAFKWNYKISNLDFVPNKRNRLHLGRKLFGDVLPLSSVVVKLPRYKRDRVSKDEQTGTGVNEKRSHLLRRGEWAVKTGGLALPIAPFLRDKKGWTTRNRGNKRRFKSLVRRRSKRAKRA